MKKTIVSTLLLSILALFVVVKFKTNSVNFLTISESTVPAKNDFDGDAKADLADIYYDAPSNQTIYYVRPSTSPFVLQVHAFPGTYDFHVSGKWYNDGKAYPAVVKKVGNGLEWTFKTADGSDLHLPYGLAGDLVPNQGDLDCDGRTDIVTTRTNVPGYWERFRVWYIAETSANGTHVTETIFGLDTDQIGLADIDGDGCDEMVVLRPGEFNWYTRKLTDTDLNPTPVQWGLPGDIPLLPADLDGDHLPDYAIVRPNGDKQTAYIRYGSGTSEVVDLGATGSVPFIGDFFGAGNSVGWVDRDKKQSFIKLASDNFPFGWGTAVAAVMRPDGTVVGVRNDGSQGNFGAAVGTTPQTTNIGRAAFAIMHKTWECDAFINSMANLPDWHVAMLYDSFGNPFDGSGNPACVERLMNDRKLKSLEVHAINTVCYRNGNCAPYEFMYGQSGFDAKLAAQDAATVARVRAYFQQIASFLAPRLKPWTTCYISPGLENDLKRPASDVLMNIARQEFPGCKIVMNPNGGSSNQNISGADFLEKHSINPDFGGAPGISNNDGRDIKFPSSGSSYSATVSEADMKKHLQNTMGKAKVVFVWMKEDNCRASSGRQAPRDRVCKNSGRFALAAKLIESVLPESPTNNPSPPPTGNLACNVIQNISDGGSKGFTYNPDNSRKKPKFIFPKEFASAPQNSVGTLITSGGNIPCPRALPDEHSNGPRPRWYCEIPVTSTPPNVTFVLPFNGQNYCATIANPTKRYD